MANPWDINQQAAQARQAELMAEGARLTLEKMRLEVEALKMAIESNTAQAVYWRAKHAREDETYNHRKKMRKLDGVAETKTDNDAVFFTNSCHKKSCGLCGAHDAVSIAYAHLKDKDETHFSCSSCGRRWTVDGIA